MLHDTSLTPLVVCSQLDIPWVHGQRDRGGALGHAASTAFGLVQAGHVQFGHLWVTDVRNIQAGEKDFAAGALSSELGVVQHLHVEV